MALSMRCTTLVALCTLISSFLSKPAIAEFDPSQCTELPLVESGLPEALRGTPDGNLQVRVALIVGNSAYKHIQPLRNPKEDAASVANSFQKLGFRTTLLLDATAKRILECKEYILARYPEVDIGILYYAGHGIQIDDTNYILGVDASQREGSTGLTDVTELVDAFQRQWKATLVFLDACRDNPYGDDRPKGLSPTTARGAVRVAYTGKLDSDPQVQPLGTFIAYSTAPYATATDGTGRLSPFASAFAENVLSPGISIQEVMAKVSRGVGEETDWAQTPWTRSSLEVALKLAGDLSASEAKARSDASAANARRLLMTGNRTEAIAEALIGIPFLPNGRAEYDYNNALTSLKNAYRSTAIRLDTEGANSVIISPDLSRALLVKFSGERGGFVELWDTLNQVLISRVFDYDGDDMFRLALVDPVFSSDSSRFASITGKGRVGIWNSTDGSLVTAINNAVRNEYEGSSPAFQRIDLNSNGTRLIASGGGIDYATLWDVDRQIILSRLAPSDLVDVLDDFPNKGNIEQILGNSDLNECSATTANVSFLNDETIVISCLCQIGHEHSRILVFVEYNNFKATDVVILEIGLSIADSKKNLDFSVNFDRSLLFTTGYQNRTSSGEMHIYDIADSRQIAKLDNPKHGVGLFSPVQDNIALIEDQKVTYFDASDGNLKKISELYSDEFLHTPTIFSMSGDIIGVDYSQLGRGIWSSIPEPLELERNSLELLNEKQITRVAKERIKFWRP